MIHITSIKEEVRHNSTSEKEDKMNKNFVVDSENAKNPHLFRDALERGFVEIVDQFLKNGADVNYVFTPEWKFKRKDYSPLHMAVVVRIKKLIQLLLDSGAYVDAKMDKDYTPLHLAVEIGYNEVVDRLLCNGADANAKAENDITPIHIATKKRNLKAIRLLIQHGAQVDNQDKDGKTILNYAVENSDLETVKEVLKNSPDINNKSNRNSLETAVNSYDKQSKEIVNALVDYGFIVNPETANNPEFLHKTIEKDYLKIVEDLLKRGADVNMFYEDNTPLHTALFYKQKEIAKLLISYKADINAKNENKNSPIYYGILYGDLKMFQILLSSGVHIKDYSELIHLFNEHFLEFFKTLIKYDVDNAPDEFGTLLNTFELVSDKGNDDINIIKEIVKVLVSRGANVDTKNENGDTVLHVAIEKGFEKLVEALLENNANVNSQGDSDNTPLHISAAVRNVQVTKMLLKKGANVDGKEKDGAAALLKGKETVELSLEHGTGVGSKMKTDLTPLHLGAIRGDRKIVEILLEFGANVNSKDERGRTPLHIASKKGYLDVVKILLQYGADLNQTCIKNDSPLAYAKQSSIEYDEYELEEDYYNDSDDDYYDCSYHDDHGDDDYYDCSYHDDHEDDDGRRYYLNCNIHKYKLTFEVLKLHTIKMKTAKLYLNEQNLHLIRICYKYGDFQNKCEEEIARMKSEKIKNTNITFYDILTKDRSSLAKCMRNENIVQALEAGGLKTIFPIYADLINLQFRKAMQRKALITPGVNSCHILFPELLHDCTEKIVSYLNDDDLRIVIEASKSGKVTEKQIVK